MVTKSELIKDLTEVVMRDRNTEATCREFIEPGDPEAGTLSLEIMHIDPDDPESGYARSRLIAILDAVGDLEYGEVVTQQHVERLIEHASNIYKMKLCYSISARFSEEDPHAEERDLVISKLEGYRKK